MVEATASFVVVPNEGLFLKLPICANHYPALAAERGLNRLQVPLRSGNFATQGANASQSNKRSAKDECANFNDVDRRYGAH